MDLRRHVGGGAFINGWSICGDINNVKGVLGLAPSSSSSISISSSSSSPGFSRFTCRSSSAFSVSSLCRFGCCATKELALAALGGTKFGSSLRRVAYDFVFAYEMRWGGVVELESQAKDCFRIPLVCHRIPCPRKHAWQKLRQPDLQRRGRPGLSSFDFWKQ